MTSRIRNARPEDMATDLSGGPSVSHGRVAVLDGLRGVAAVVVLIFHLVQQYDLHSLPFAALAVDFFYVLSGFVVALAYEQPLRIGAMDFRAFAKVRLRRLYPLALLGTSFGILLALGAATIKKDISVEQVTLAGVLGLLLLPSFVFRRWDTAYPFNMMSWSLTFELFVNAVYAIIVRKLTSNRLIALVVLSACLLVWLALVNNGIKGGNNQDGFSWGFARVMFPFFAGVLLCRHRIKRRFPAMVGVLLMLLLAVLLLSPWPKSPFVSLFLVIVVFPALVAVGATIEAEGALEWLCRKGGQISYPIYILQGPVLRIGEEFMKHRHFNTAMSYTFAIGEAFAVLMVAWGGLILYDIPIQRLLRGSRLVESNAELKQPTPA
jgi:peptidoglycan/LPS O-acetylase OafA/YrhL